MRKKRYTPEHEQAILTVLENLKEESIDQKVSTLNSRGIRNANGYPFNSGTLYFFIRSRKEKLTPTTSIHRNIQGIPRLIAEALLAEPTLSDRQRVGMLQAYLNS